MATSEALRIDITGKELTKIYPGGALLSNDSIDWGGFYWQYYRQSPFEMVEHSCPQHRIIINDRALQSPIVETFEGENQLNPVSSGTVRKKLLIVWDLPIKAILAITSNALWVLILKHFSKLSENLLKSTGICKTQILQLWHTKAIAALIKR